MIVVEKNKGKKRKTQTENERVFRYEKNILIKDNKLIKKENNFHTGSIT